MNEQVLFIGVDVGRSTRAALVDMTGSIRTQYRKPTRLEGGHALVDGLLDAITHVINSASSVGPVAAVGVGVPGLVNHQTRRIEVLPNLPEMFSIDPRGDLQAAINLPVVIENDANTAAYGEWRCGAAQGAHDAIYISVGTGIGAGLVLGGRLHVGTRGFSGELGHFKVAIDGLECSCGSSGCLETVASGPNIVRRARELMFAEPRFSLSALASKMSGQLTCEEVVAAAVDDDFFARTVLAETAAYLGMAVANAVNLLNVELVVLGGPVLATNDYLLDQIRQEAGPRSFGPAFASCRIVRSALGAEAGVIGAAMMARDELGFTTNGPESPH